MNFSTPPLTAAGFAFLLFFSTSSQATVAPLLSNQRWLTVATSPDIDTAVGIANYYGWKGAKVMSAVNGTYAINLGPYTATTREELAKQDFDLAEIPTDFRFSESGDFLDVVWDVPSNEQVAPMVEYGIGKPAALQLGKIAITVAMEGSEDAPGPTVITGKTDTQSELDFKTASDFVNFGASAGILRLDPATLDPQLVVTRFSGGAHCCTAHWLFTAPKDAKGWNMVALDMKDGGGYSYIDLDRDGDLEIVTADNNFLYAFSSYAGSYAPQRISQLQGTQLVDVTADPAYRFAVKRDLATKEFAARIDPTQWKSTGFLAAWVALKNQLGQGDEAWNFMEKNFEQEEDFGPQECTSGETLDDCPADNLKTIAFPKALAGFLQKQNYGVLPAAAQALLK